MGFAKKSFVTQYSKQVLKQGNVKKPTHVQFVPNKIVIMQKTG